MDQIHDRLYCMDCMELFGELSDKCVSLILADPPYGIHYQNNFAQHPHPLIAGDGGMDYERFAQESYRILKDNTHAYFFTRFDCYPYHYDCLKEVGFSIKNCLVVEKGNVGGIGDLRGSFANNAEWIIFCQKGRRTFNDTSLLQNRKKEGYHLDQAQIPASGIRLGLMPAGSGMSTPKLSHLPVYLLNEDQLSAYSVYMANQGNRPDLFPTDQFPNASQREDYLDYDVPPEALEDEVFAAMLNEAEKYLGMPYVWGGSSPSTSFDCSGFVSWVINHSGWNVGRLGAKALCNLCTPVSPANARPGDLVFFINTYDAPDPNAPTHCGIYVGGNMMIHCGNVRPDRTEVEVDERRTEKGATP